MNLADIVPYSAGLAFFVVVFRAMVWTVRQSRETTEDQVARLKAEQLRADTAGLRVTELEHEVATLKVELAQVRYEYKLMVAEVARLKEKMEGHHGGAL